MPYSERSTTLKELCALGSTIEMYERLSELTSDLEVPEVVHLINIKETKFGNFTQAKYTARKHTGELHQLRSKISKALLKEAPKPIMWRGILYADLLTAEKDLLKL